MAYIVKRKNREGNEYVYLVESFREKDKVKNRTLKTYGRYDAMEEANPGAYERLRQQAEQGLLVGEMPKQLKVTYDTEMEIGMFDKTYGWKLFESMMERLHIEQALIETVGEKAKAERLKTILELLVYQRILHPGSKLYTLHRQEEMFGTWEIDENALYRSLGTLAGAKERIQWEAHRSITELTNRTGTLVFYDVTNYYFDIDFDDPDKTDEASGEVTDGFRKRGPCKAHSGNPIVQMGLFMDAQGIPISYQLFRGNFTDPVTYIPAIEQVKKQFGLERIVVVADKAMNSKNNVSKTHQNQDGWLFSQKHRGMQGSSKELQAFIMDPSGWAFNEAMTFASKSMIRKRKLKDQTTIEEKVLITWNKKYAEREKTRRDGALEYASKLTDAELYRQTSKRGGKKYLEVSYLDKTTGEIKPFSPLIQLDVERIAFDEQFDGVNVLVTSETKMSDEEMIEAYGQLYLIEDCFRVTKTELSAKPVYVRLETHIEAHFLTCFLALVLVRLIQHKTKWAFSVEKLIEALNSARATELTTGFYQVQANETLKQILQALEIPWDKAIVRYEDLKNFGKDWCTTNP